MDVVLMDAAVVSDPSLVLRGLTEVARIRSLCTWGALLLAAVAALGSLVRTLRRTVRWLRRHRQRVVAAAGCGGPAMMGGGSIVPKPSVDFSDEDTEWESVDSDEPEEEEDEKDEVSGCSVQDWGFGSGGWESWFGGNVVKHWDEEEEEEEDDNNRTRSSSRNGFFSLVSPSSRFVPLIKSAFCLQLDTPSLTLGCSDGLDLKLWDSRLRSSVPAAVIGSTDQQRLLRKRGVAAGGNNKVVYLAENGGGGAVVDLRNPTRSVLRMDGGGVKDTWRHADEALRPGTDRRGRR